MNDATKAAKILGGLTSKRKARAARINGKKGGRPRTAQKEQEQDGKLHMAGRSKVKNSIKKNGT